MKYLTVLLAICTFPLMAQNLRTPTLSPISKISQEIGLTEISLSYSRPSAKGRTVFGELVPFGEIWRTGANASTQLTFSEEVKIDGKDLPAGTYALYTIPGEKEWTIIIHKNTKLRSIAGGRVKPENDAFRFTVKPGYSALPIETFTMQFTDIQTNSCKVQLAWEHTLVSFGIEVEVDAKIDAQLAALLADPEKATGRVYFRAAEYNLHNKRDLTQALKWIDKALEKSENNFRYGLLKAKIYEAQGNRAMALETIQAANEWANTAKNDNYQKQTQVYWEGLKVKEQVKGDNKEENPYATDVANLDNIMKALYGVISGDKGVKRDWERFRYLFVPNAQLIPSGANKEGKVGHQIIGPEDYIQRSGKFLEENGFHEVEIHREVSEYGSLVNVFSTYEAYRSEAAAEPFMRGINSIQLLNDGNRWWIVQIYWRQESKDLPLPDKYLPK